MKKVLFLIDSLTCGGAEKSLVSLLPLLDYSKFEVDLIMVNREGIFEQYVPKEVNIISFPKQGGLFFKLCQTLFSLSLRIFPNRHGAELRWQTMGRAYRGVEKEYDVAIAYQQGFPTYYLAEKVKANKKYAWINVDIKTAGYRESYNRLFYDKMDKVIAVSDVLYEMLKNSTFVNQSKLTSVYDILNVNLIKRMATNTIPGFSFECKDNRLMITTVGRCVYQKGYDIAVEAARILKERGLGFLWYFVGGGNKEETIKQMIRSYGLEDFIVMTGMQPNPYPFMAAADIYVQTSRFEGFGLTLNEARILNKPVISTNFPVVYNQIHDGENGLICEMTPESIAEKISLLINNEYLREQLVEATKKEVNTTAITEPKKVMDLVLD